MTATRWQIVQNFVLRSSGKSWVGFRMAQLSTRHLSPNSPPRCAHNSFKLIQIVPQFGLSLPARNICPVRSADWVSQFVGFSCCFSLRRRCYILYLRSWPISIAVTFWLKLSVDEVIRTIWWSPLHVYCSIYGRLVGNLEHSVKRPIMRVHRICVNLQIPWLHNARTSIQSVAPSAVAVS